MLNPRNIKVVVVYLYNTITKVTTVCKDTENEITVKICIFYFELRKCNQLSAIFAYH
eukprot:GAHX01003861.1.p2 GENE.GAHX01003861.1~~GAHX01003861.1.p2  ORF type:complete len:57 (+),score=4.82 GAHX01003861.1:87-257(+)